MKATKKMLALLGVSVLAFAANAVPTVTLNNVRQRYPWNNKVDITYTVSGYNAATDDNNFAVKFKAAIPSFESGAEQSAGMVYLTGGGTFTYTWEADTVANTADDSCKMSVEVYDLAGIAPTTSLADGDYEIWDLAASPITNYYENVIVFAGVPNQELSNLRYNTEEYKTDKLVLRKVTKGKTFTVGADFADHPASGATEAQLKRHPKRSGVTIDKDYFIGVFPLTQYQYAKISSADAPSEANKLKPKASISYNALRGGSNADSSAAIAADGFLYTLNQAVSGSSGNFELPTQNQWEIAAKGGQNSAHPDWMWFFTNDDETAVASIGSYAWYSGNSGNATHSVGEKLPNELGLYDIYGNVWEWCRDTYVDAAGSTDTDVLNYSAEGANVSSGYRIGTGSRADRGGAYNGTAGGCSSAFRGGDSASNANASIGVRLARAAE